MRDRRGLSDAPAGIAGCQLCIYMEVLMVLGREEAELRSGAGQATPEAVAEPDETSFSSRNTTTTSTSVMKCLPLPKDRSNS